MSATETWEAVLDAPSACDHLVQLYTDDDFLARAVAHFVGAGFGVGEAAVIIATPAHLARFLDRLPEGPDALARGQLIAIDAADCLKSAPFRRAKPALGAPQPARVFRRASRT
jgi:hypothetical protein